MINHPASIQLLGIPHSWKASFGELALQLRPLKIRRLSLFAQLLVVFFIFETGTSFLGTAAANTELPQLAAVNSNPKAIAKSTDLHNNSSVLGCLETANA